MAFDWISDVADIAGSGAQIARAFGGRKESKASKESRRSAKQARAYAQAAADPTSAPFRNLAGQYDRENRQALIQAIDRIMRDNAREKARGGVGFGINPERRDESRYKALARQFMDSREASRREARDTLLAAGGGITQSAQALPVAAGEQRAEGNFDRTGTGVAASVDLAKILAELFQGQPSGRSVSSTTFPSSGTRSVNTSVGPVVPNLY
jgi:hypothetical protein